MQKEKVLIIAEAGVNHNGILENAFKLVDAAKDAGADYVKFQTFKAEKLVSKSARQADYQAKNMGDTIAGSQFEMLKKLELSEVDHERLSSYCKEKEIEFLSTGFDLDSLEYLANIGISLSKVPSGEITNLPYLKKVATLYKKVILSTGMASLEEIKQALKVLTDGGVDKNNIIVLHCNTEYPTPMKDVNLKAMLHIRDVLDIAVGYSDHTLGIEVPIAAVALGAVVIEKHFTISKTMDGPDHKASLEPQELKHMVAAIRNIEQAVAGSGYKEPSESELKNIFVARKSIHLNTSLKKGEMIKDSDLIMLRPGDGISPMKMEMVIGKQAVIDMHKGHKLTLNDIV
jgi:N-acetylneuraminate synthase